jgi:RNA polymerase sigma factor (sigma-70 family)
VLSHLDRHGRRAGDLNPLLNTIAKNLVVERFRTGGRELPVEFDEHLTSDAPDPGDQVASRDRNARVHAAIRELPLGQRRALFLWIEGLRPAEIARVLGLKRNAVDALLHRARRQLTTRLEGCRDSVFGAGFMLRLRLRVRHAIEWARVPEFAPAYGQAIAAVATVAMLAVVSDSVVSPPAAPVEGRESTSSMRTAADRAATHGKPGDATTGGGRRTTSDGSRTTPPEGAHVDLRGGRASVVTEAEHPVTGERGPLGIMIYTEPEDDDGVSGLIIDTSIEAICSTQPDLCEGG